MKEPIEIYRKEATQRVLMANSRGGWEGTHTDFKRELPNKPRDLAKLLKHILAFANTPRRTDAYIIFGVNEEKQRGIFEHVGARESEFPSRERIDDFIHQYTRLSNIFVDSAFYINGK